MYAFVVSTALQEESLMKRMMKGDMKKVTETETEGEKEMIAWRIIFVQKENWIWKKN